MSFGIGVAMVLIVFGLAACIFVVQLLRGGGKRVSFGKVRAPQAPPADDRAPPCKETCDIHGKLGAVIRYDCGHDDHEEFRVDLWGEPKFHKKPEYGTLLCSECLLKEALSVSIRCGGCGHAIMPGDPISLCVDDGSGKPEWRTVREGQLALCLRISCDAMPGFCGHWTGDGIRWAFQGRTMIGHVFETGEAVAVGDLGDDGTKPES